MTSEDAKFAGEEGEEHRRPAWRRLMEQQHTYLLRRGDLEGFVPAEEFVKRVEIHSWGARDDFRNHRLKYTLGFPEWFINRLIPTVIATRNEFDAHGNFAGAHLEKIRMIAVRWLRGDDPDELINTLWIAVMRYLPNYDPDRGKFRFWINQIAENEAKKLYSQRQPSTDLRLEEAAAATEVTLMKDPDPEYVDRMRSWADGLMARLRKRDEMAAEILRRRVVDGLEFHEMARLWREDPRLVKTFDTFFRRTRWEPTDDERKCADKLRRLFNEILKKLRKAEGEVS